MLKHHTSNNSHATESFVGKSTIVGSIISTPKSRSIRSGKRVTFLLDDIISEEDECDSSNDDEYQSNPIEKRGELVDTDNEKAGDGKNKTNNETDEETTDDEDVMSEIGPRGIPSNVPQIINTSSNGQPLINCSKTSASWERPTSQQLLIMMRQISASSYRPPTLSSTNTHHQQPTTTTSTTNNNMMTSLKSSSSRHNNNRRQYKRSLIILACTTIALMTMTSITTSLARETHLLHLSRASTSCWLSVSVSFLFHAALAVPATQQQQHEHIQQNVDNNNNDESMSSSSRPLNYYELLNLETPTTHYRSSTKTLHNRKKRTSYRNKITTSDIKKAYRKQAQLYHPDKAKRHNMTTDEATERFAEIANAYSIL